MSVIQTINASRLKIMGSVLLLVVIAGVSYQIYQYWPLWLKTSVIWQRQLNLSLTELLQSTQEQPFHAGLLLIGVSFLYGLLHAIGPGHGKLIITTYIATQPTQLKQSVVLSLLASLLQGLVAIVLVSVILIIFQLSTRHLHMVGQYSEKLSYAFVILLGVLCCFKALRQGWKIRQKKAASVLRIQSVSVLNSTKPNAVIKPPSNVEPICGCGHQHVPAHHQLHTNLKTQAIVVLSMGLRPCSGALLVLLFSYVIGVYQWGILAALAMAVGTALTICAIALFVYSMRNVATQMAKSKGFTWSPYWGIAISLCAGVIFILLGLLMYQSLILNEVVSPLLAPRSR
ncbi:nickel/cobalt transporter [Providencia manganoxydans]|uniref:nickel/cobalt transporter n=1 Tax=Providencia manganoxydans TaxID=2923283 RepID=UPI0032DB8BA6